jgi:uncharacterized coiled-coil protein SlyX
MFNKKKIEVIEKKLEEQQKDINKNQEKISTLKDKLKELTISNKELKSSMDKILDTLEGENFSKEWDEYQKYKEMKDQLPDIEEMYQIKRLKQLIIQRENLSVTITNCRLLLASQEALNPHSFSTSSTASLLNDYIKENNSIFEGIDGILKYLKSKSDQKDLLELFKLYAISTEWLKP